MAVYTVGLDDLKLRVNFHAVVKFAGPSPAIGFVIFVAVILRILPGGCVVSLFVLLVVLLGVCSRVLQVIG